MPAQEIETRRISSELSYAETPHAKGEVMMFPGAPMADGPKIIEPEEEKAAPHEDDIQNFRDFLRSILIHGSVGTAIGGCTPLVGEPQVQPTTQLCCSSGYQCGHPKFT